MEKTTKDTKLKIKITIVAIACVIGAGGLFFGGIVVPGLLGSTDGGGGEAGTNQNTASIIWILHPTPTLNIGETRSGLILIHEGTYNAITKIETCTPGIVEATNNPFKLHAVGVGSTVVTISYLRPNGSTDTREIRATVNPINITPPPDENGQENNSNGNTGEGNSGGNENGGVNPGPDMPDLQCDCECEVCAYIREWWNSRAKN